MKNFPTNANTKVNISMGSQKELAAIAGLTDNFMKVSGSMV